MVAALVAASNGARRGVGDESTAHQMARPDLKCVFHRFLIPGFRKERLK
jgi:hypothetical protein